MIKCKYIMNVQRGGSIMKIFKKWTAGISALVLSVGMYTALPMGAQAVDDKNDDWIHAVGSRLYDKDGNQVWITGVNWFGFNCIERFPHGLWSADVDVLLSSVADHGINTIRFPIATELILDWMDGVDDSESISINPKNSPDYSFNPDFCRPDGSCMSSEEICDVIIQKCKKYGIKVFFDIHSPALHNSGHNYNVWYYNDKAGDAGNMAVTADGVQVTTQMWQDSLVWLAAKYANDDTVIAYDLKNEPHGKGQEGSAAAKWDGSSDENNWAYAATNCALAIMEVNPNALILVEGVEQYPREGRTWGEPDSLTNPPYIPGWWGGQLRGVRDYPIDLGKYQSQLMYSPHDYGPSVYAQTWFEKDFTTQTLLDDYWYDTWAFINEEDIAPLLIGEWGGHMDDGKNQKWMELLRDYMIDNHINHTFWCLNPNSGDTGGLMDYSFQNWDDEKYTLFEPSLWQTSTTGKYIGLDHQTPLGVNGTGLSVSEYYASYDAKEGSNLDSNGKTEPIEPPTAPPTDESSQEPTTEGENTDVDYGNVDLSESVDIGDVICLCKATMGTYTLTAQGMKNADVDLNGVVDTTDAAYILQSLIGLVKLPVTK